MTTYETAASAARREYESEARDTVRRERRHRMKRGTYGTCLWFAECGRPATGTTDHPILGPVPTCERCHKFATS